jgi:uncharacterized RDD family membrane protein YckC
MSTPIASNATAPKGLRVLGYLIDIIPAFLLSLFGLIPIIGPVIVGLLLTPYWLLRDISGRSLGKMALDMNIVDTQGNAPTKGALVLRNLPFIIGSLFMIIPILGYIGPFISLFVLIIETIFLLAQGQRLGDKLAGTVVVKVSSQNPA